MTPSRTFACFSLLAASLLLLPQGLRSQENTLHQSVQAAVLVADAEQAADRLEAWSESQGGYLLLKSSQRLLLRLPNARVPLLRGFLEQLSEDVVELNSQAVDLREQLLSTQARLRSREEILKKNLALLDQADRAGTLAIEKELLGLIAEVENLKAARQKLSFDQAFARVEISLKFLQPTLPKDIPSSFDWINQVSFGSFIEEGY